MNPKYDEVPPYVAAIPYVTPFETVSEHHSLRSAGYNNGRV